MWFVYQSTIMDETHFRGQQFVLFLFRRLLTLPQHTIGFHVLEPPLCWFPRTRFEIIVIGFVLNWNRVRGFSKQSSTDVPTIWGLNVLRRNLTCSQELQKRIFLGKWFVNWRIDGCPSVVDSGIRRFVSKLRSIEDGFVGVFPIQTDPNPCLMWTERLQRVRRSHDSSTLTKASICFFPAVWEVVNCTRVGRLGADCVQVRSHRLMVTIPKFFV